MRRFNVIILACLAMAMCIGCSSKKEHRAFFYAGESPVHRMYIVEDGKVTWEYVNTQGRGEISDAVLMDDGNIVIAHQYGLQIITPEKKIIWSYEAPEKTEIHTVQPIGDNHLVFVQNDDPGKVRVIRLSDKAIVKEFPLPINQPASIHGQFRCARLTKFGTLLVANMGMGFIAEYDIDGNELHHYDFPHAWGVQALPDGNFLAASNQALVKEYTREGDVVWELNMKDKVDTYGVTSGQKAYRLPNGNTVIGNWVNYWNKQEKEQVENDPENAPVQFIEVNPKGEVVWTLRSWKDPDLGPSTTYQPIDEPVVKSSLFFGDIK